MLRPLLPPAAPARPVVRVVHPCGAVAEHTAAIEAGVARLEAHGCAVRWEAGAACREWRGYLAGDDDERAAELLAAFTEPGVDIVWLARGGSGLARIAERVLTALRDVPPRLLVGFSDATVLLNALAVHLGWTTFHGPMVASLARPDIDCDLDEVLEVLRGERRELPLAGTGGPRAEGVLLGGNLSVLACTAGTRLWPHRRGAVWLLEDVNEARYRLDRAFWQVRAAGLLDGAAALWLGDLHLPPEEESLAAAMFTEDAAPLPVLRGAPAGHRGRLTALPIGGRVALDAGGGRLRATAPWVAVGRGHV